MSGKGGMCADEDANEHCCSRMLSVQFYQEKLRKGETLCLVLQEVRKIS
jgi:hypothetical protein